MFAVADRLGFFVGGNKTTIERIQRMAADAKNSEIRHFIQRQNPANHSWTINPRVSAVMLVETRESG